MFVGRKKEMSEYLKAVEQDRKNKMISHFQHTKSTHERRSVMEAEVMQSEIKRQKDRAKARRDER